MLRSAAKNVNPTLELKKAVMKTGSYFFFIGLFLSCLACGDDDVANQETAISPIGQCHFLFDDNGQAIGTLGNCTNFEHWKASELLAQEKGWLAFSDSLAFSAAHVPFDELLFSTYPIPAQSNGNINLSIFASGDANALSKLKLVILDESEKLRFTLAQTLVTGSNNVQFSLDGFLPGQSYRMYYQVAANEQAAYFEGFGDFFVCDQFPLLDYEDCL